MPLLSARARGPARPGLGAAWQTRARFRWRAREDGEGGGEGGRGAGRRALRSGRAQSGRPGRGRSESVRVVLIAAVRVRL